MTNVTDFVISSSTSAKQNVIELVTWNSYELCSALSAGTILVSLKAASYLGNKRPDKLMDLKEIKKIKDIAGLVVPSGISMGITVASVYNDQYKKNTFMQKMMSADSTDDINNYSNNDILSYIRTTTPVSFTQYSYDNRIRFYSAIKDNTYVINKLRTLDYDWNRLVTILNENEDVLYLEQ